MSRLKFMNAVRPLCVLVMLGLFAPAQAADKAVAATPATAAINPATDMAKLAALVARLQAASAGSEEYAAVANEVGPVVDELRQAGLDAKQLDAIRRQLEQMRVLADQRLDQYEAATNENEGALENMYRSRVWDDMSFALAAFPYWRAWIDLELARMVNGQGEKSQALKPARDGFKAASVQLFKPGLVYGGWLGLGRQRETPVLPALMRVHGVAVQCIHGTAEKDSLCRDLRGEHVVQVVERPGGHHFDRDPARLTQIILDGWNAARTVQD